jgi:hypothetical protein
MRYDLHWRMKSGISGFGAFCTGVVMIIFAVTKFTSGAWFVVLLVPTLVFIFFRIHYHYRDVARLLSLEGVPVDVDKRPVQTIILVDDVHAETALLVNFAKSLDHPWHAVHIAVNPDKVEVIRKKWQDRIGEGELVVIPSPYRLLAEPLRQYIEELQARTPGSFAHIIMGHLAMDTFWEQALHQNSAVTFPLPVNVQKKAPVPAAKSWKTPVPSSIRVAPRLNDLCSLDRSDANEARCQVAISRRRSAAASSSTKLAQAKKAMEKRGRMELSGPPSQLIWWAETNENQCVMHEVRAA